MLDATILIAITIGLIEVLKKTGLNSRYAPLVSILIGVAVYGFGNGFDVFNIFQGIIVGLSSAGLYSGTKATFK